MLTTKIQGVFLRKSNQIFRLPARVLLNFYYYEIFINLRNLDSVDCEITLCFSLRNLLSQFKSSWNLLFGNIFTEKMKLFVGFFLLIAARTECNGADYSPLGCFTDDPPFSVPGYRPSRMPQSVSKVTCLKRFPFKSFPRTLPKIFRSIQLLN